MTQSGLPSGGERPDRAAVGGGRARRRLILAGCLLLLAAAAVPVLRQCTGPRPAPGPWVFAVCDVGQGDALFLADGPHTAVAVDTGPDPDREDACARRLGITDVPLVILTHFHADHVDGLSGLLRGRRVGEIETTTVDDPPYGAALVARLAAAAHVPEVRVRPDEQRAIGPLSWRVLWPQAEHPLIPPAGAGGTAGMSGRSSSGRSSSGSRGGRGGAQGAAEDGSSEDSGPNNDSIVMAVSIAVPGAPAAPLRLLLTGDIETPVQQTLYADRRAYLAADVLKVPHHGSAKQDPDFLAAVRPSLSVISVGAGNPYGHPAPRTVYLAGQDGARVYRTDLDGMVLIGAPAAAGAPIPVTADRGDGTVPTGPPPSPSHSSRSYGGRGGRGGHSYDDGRRSRDHYGDGGHPDTGDGRYPAGAGLVARVRFPVPSMAPVSAAGLRIGA